MPARKSSKSGRRKTARKAAPRKAAPRRKAATRKKAAPRKKATARKKSASTRKYGDAAEKSVESAMHRYKKGTLRSGKAGKATSRKQAIAIGLSEAREKGAKVPRKKAS